MQRPTPRLASALAALGFALAPAANAQAGDPLSGSPSFLAAGRSLVAAAGASDSPNFSAESVVGDELSAAQLASAQYTALTPVLSVSDLLAPGPPFVIGTLGEQGPSAGGVPVELIGTNFASVAGGTPIITFDGAQGASVQVLDDTRLLVTPPAGENSFGNPLGEVAVGASSNLGQTSTPDAFVYAPALRETDPAEVPGSYGFQLVAEPGTLGIVYVGASVPGFAIPVPGIQGGLELNVGTPVDLVSGTAGADGIRAFGLPIPDKPALIGQTVHLQALAAGFAPALSIRFTNRIPLTFLP